MEKKLGLVTYPFVLRKNMIISLQLPNDLTQEEVKKLEEFLYKLVRINFS